jgi:hypothetical protein
LTSRLLALPPLPPGAQSALDRWIAALEARHLRDLTFQEVARALRALSSCYVERRDRLGRGEALEGRGKRAAFAVFYGPLHLMTTAHITEEVGVRVPSGGTLVDIGCGNGAASAGWALVDGGVPLLGIDRNPWAVREAEWTWRTLGLHGTAVRGDVTRLRLPRGPFACLAAFSANELVAATRDWLKTRLLDVARQGRTVLVIEPIAISVTPWWDDWRSAFLDAGGEERTWRFRPDLPDLVQRLDRAAGLNHTELTARSMHIAGRST